MGSSSGNAEARRKKLFVLANEIGLTRFERIEVSRVILWRDITSWSNLDEGEVNRLLDAFEGYEKIKWLLENRSGTES